MRTFRVLKWIRVVVALVFFLLIAFLFLDFAGLFPEVVYNSATYLQFAPSVLKFTQLIAWSALGFAFVIVLTFLFGRTYCSTICPLGTLQDFLIRFNKKLGISKKFTYYRSYYWLQYSLLGITVVVFLLGSAMMFNLLDPFTNFGKIIANVFRPVYVVLNNLGAWVLNKMDIYSLYHVDYKAFAWPAFLFSVGFLLLLFFFTRVKGRLFCNTLCPVGAVLGSISRLSIYKIRIKENECTVCMRCALDCKAGCIDAKNKKIDFGRCIGCLNCLNSCPNQGVVFVPAWKNYTEVQENKTADISKRNFIKFTALFSLGFHKLLNAQNEIVPEKESTIPEEKEFSVSPPGSMGIKRFNELCTACHLCVSACPTQVIQPSFLQYGLAGMMQPYLDYHKSFCNFECKICTEICPSGALLPLSLGEKKLTQLGKVIFEKKNCIVETEGTDCGACSEHCPTKAAYMIPYNGLFLPEVDTDICIGCGACEYACPTHPYKAIYVDGNPKHVKADKPETEKLEEPEGEEFPF